jgi:hypothetical protein
MEKEFTEKALNYMGQGNSQQQLLFKKKKKPLNKYWPLKNSSLTSQVETCKM